MFNFPSLGMFGGMKIVIAAQHPRYTLPEELIPGVPWPAGFREEINEWSKSFLGTTCIVPKGTSYVLHGNTVIVHPEDYKLYAKIVNL